MSVVVYTCKPNIPEVEAVGSGIQGHLQPQGELKGSLGSMRSERRRREYSVHRVEPSGLAITHTFVPWARAVRSSNHEVTVLPSVIDMDLRSDIVVMGMPCSLTSVYLLTRHPLDSCLKLAIVQCGL